ncbi:MAG: ABC transporter ATP-binding protein [Silicimonas sp.]|nr:ABC transporter ATP-binding protein [Silicimonas sp.]
MAAAGQKVFAPWDDPDAVPLIRIEGVTKRFGEFTAIDDISLDIHRQEFFALLGPSGCGKTTVMRMLAGFETPSEGRITIDGQDQAGVAPNKRAVNMMFQSYALFPHLSVWENVAFGLRRDGLDKDRIDARVDEMLRLVQLEKFAKRKPHQISGGQRQRVALARSLAKAPKLLLLDEPLGALDKKLRQDTQFELMDIQETTGTTFVIVTHDQEEAMTVASRVAVMDHGLIKQVATPERIYEQPNSVYVADFIGDVNLIGGRVAAVNGAAELDWAEGRTPLIGQTGAGLAKGDKATFAIRPEKIAISADEPEARNRVRGKILDIGYLGNLSTYHVELPEGPVVKCEVGNRSRLERRDFTWEDEVWLSWTDTAGLVLPE